MSVIKCGFEIEVIGQLSDELSKLSVYDDVIVVNYDGQGAGNHRVGNFVEALGEVGCDFDVVKVEPCNSKEKYSYHQITVQTKDDDAFQRLDYLANRNAIRHDRYMGDGKYERAETFTTFTKKDVVVESVKAHKKRQVQDEKDGK